MLGGWRLHWSDLLQSPCLTDAWSDWPTPWALYCVPQAVPEQCLWCVRAHWPARRPLPLGCVVVMRGCTWSTAVFGWWCVSSVTWMPAPKVSQQNIALWWDDQLFTSPVSGFNVVADQCTHMLWLYSQNISFPNSCSNICIKKTKKKTKHHAIHRNSFFLAHRRLLYLSEFDKNAQGSNFLSWTNFFGEYTNMCNLFFVVKS